MAQGREFLRAKNAQRAAERAARGAQKRVDRGGVGRAMARAAWSARRSAKRLAARRRQEVVGYVRLVGKGPPPRAGPVLPKGVARLAWSPGMCSDIAISSTQVCWSPTSGSMPASPEATAEDGWEPIDEAMLGFLDEHMAECDALDEAWRRQVQKVRGRRTLRGLCRLTGMRLPPTPGMSESERPS